MNIALKGGLIYERGDILQFLKMLHSGLFPPRGEVRGYKGFGDGGLGGGDGCWGAAGGDWEVCGYCPLKLACDGWVVGIIGVLGSISPLECMCFTCRWLLRNAIKYIGKFQGFFQLNLFGSLSLRLL